MGEKVINATIQVLVEKLLTATEQEIGLFLGFKNELKKMEKSLKMIQAFLHDVLKRHVEDDHAVNQWLQHLEDVAYDADNLLDEFNYETIRRKVEIDSQMKRKLLCSYSFSFLNRMTFRGKMGHKIKNVNTKLEIVNKEASSYGLQNRVADSAVSLPLVMETNSIAVDPIFIGRDKVTSAIIDDMVKWSNELVVSVVPIVGMGGMGKTALARKVFNHQSIEKHFSARIWVSLSQNIDNKSLLVKILESLTNESVLVSLGEEAVLRQLQSKLNNTRYVIVLDDYLYEKIQEWDNFMNCIHGISQNKGNFIIMTTRNQNVASIVTPQTVHSLCGLSNEDCWSIIKARAFPSQQVPRDFEGIGMQIAYRCRGLPLAANVVGGSLRGKGIDDWTSFLHENGFSMYNPSDDFVLQVLKISFDRLPSILLKKCFAYCSIFSKGEQIEREQLIQLWMAEGFLFGSSHVSDHHMEGRGDNVYNILLQNFFLHEAVKDDYGRVKYSKMHDLAHDLSCLVAKREVLNVEEVICPVRYLAFVDDKQKITKEQTIYLRTSFVSRGKAELINNIFQNCKCLRVLDLRGTMVEELTSTIDKLIHLRFLDLSFTRIRSLPDSLCKLFNLQTLRLISCYHLRELPNQLKFLVGLRHLHFRLNFCLQMPLEVGKLTSLRTLNFFIVGDEKGRQIDELGYLKNLQGKLGIHNLEKVNGKEESMKACLIEKQNLERLKFVWSKSSTEGNINDYEVLEGLQPHPNLKGLAIKNFGGDYFPLWTMKMIVEPGTILHKLIKIVFIDCEKCQEIPTLGHLPVLKILEVRGLKNLRSIGPSFYISNHHCDDESSKYGVQFPALECLKLQYMDNLREWAEAPNTVTTAFPNLEYLEILSCRDIMTAPSHDFPSLKSLKIGYVDSEVPLATICNKLSSLTKLVIDKNSNLTSLPEMLFYKNQRLQCLVIDDCDNLTQLELSDTLRSLRTLEIRNCSNLSSLQYQTTHSEGLTSLHDLEISNCKKLTGFPSKMLDSCTSLEFLCVSECMNLSSIPVNWQTMQNLFYLKFSLCPRLRSLPDGIDCLNKLTEVKIGPFSEETGFNEALKGVHKLHKLTLFGKPDWECLPDQLQYLTALTYLYFSDFGIEALPEWFSNMSSLKHLVVSNCKRLRHITCLKHLTKLENLDIHWCTLLKEAFQSRNHSQWSEISHIPNIHVN